MYIYSIQISCGETLVYLTFFFTFLPFSVLFAIINSRIWDMDDGWHVSFVIVMFLGLSCSAPPTLSGNLFLIFAPFSSIASLFYVLSFYWSFAFCCIVFSLLKYVKKIYYMLFIIIPFKLDLNYCSSNNNNNIIKLKNGVRLWKIPMAHKWMMRNWDWDWIGIITFTYKNLVLLLLIDIIKEKKVPFRYLLGNDVT